MNLTKFQLVYRMLPPGAGWREFYILAQVLAGK